jgi:tryptophan-rich sensory protein
MNYNKWFKFISYFFLASSIGIFISIPFVKYTSESWYNKSPINPPAELFAPMWGSLFLLIFLSIRELNKSKKKLNLCFWLFSIQLLFNFVWGALFSLKDLVLPAISLIFAWFFIIATLVEFRKISKKAGWLLLPYLSWVNVAVIVSLANVIVN